jgi:hypothetical protein
MASRFRLVSTLRIDFCFLVSFRREFLGHGFLDFFDVHPVAFGGVHENVVAAGGGSLIRRIQQADFEKQPAQFGLVRCADLPPRKTFLAKQVSTGRRWVEER